MCLHTTAAVRAKKPAPHPGTPMVQVAGFSTHPVIVLIPNFDEEGNLAFDDSDETAEVRYSNCWVTFDKGIFSGT